MKSAIALTAAVITSAGLAGITPAAAYRLSPQGGFTGSGKTSATKNGISLPCIAHFTGKVTSTGIGYVTGGTFKDNGGVGCTSVKLNNLPWRSAATSATGVKIYNVTFTSPIGNCGPGALLTTLRNGVIRFTAAPLPGGCTVTGTIKTTPTVSIVP